MNLFFRIFLLLLFSVSSRAQEFIFENVSQLKDLPSPETYNIVQDARGYIWIGTEQGLCRFNGESFKMYTVKEGLEEKAVYALSKDIAGNIWVGTSAGRILKIVNDSLIEAPFSKDASLLLNKNESYITKILFADKSTLIVSSFYITLKINLETNKVVILPRKEQIITHRYELQKIDSILVPVAAIEKPSPKMRIFINSIPASKLLLIDGDDFNEITFKLPSSVDAQLFRIFAGSNQKGQYFIVSSKVLISSNLKGDCQSEMLPFEVLSMYIDKRNNLWLGTMNGMCYIPNGEINSGKEFFSLKGHRVSNIMEDDQGNIWCTTLDDGVKICRNPNIELLYSNTDEVQNLQIPPIFETFDNKINIFSLKKIVVVDENKTTYYPLFNDSLFIPTAALYDKNWIVSTKNGVARYNENFSQKNSIVDPVSGKKIQAINYIKSFNNGRIFFCNQTDLFEFKNQKIKTIPIDCKSNIKGITVFNGNVLIVYTRDNIYELNVDSYVLKPIVSINNIKKVVVGHNGQFFIANISGQLFRYTNNMLSEIQIDPYVLRINDMDIDAEGNLWFTSEKGIGEIKNADQYTKTTWYSPLKYYGTNEYFKIGFSGKRVVVSTRESVYRFSRVKNSKINHVKIHLNSLLINDALNYQNTDSINLNYDQNTLRFKFDVLAFKEKPGLVYTVKNYFETPIAVEQNEFTLTKLPPGEFILKVHAINQEEEQISEEILIPIYVSTPWWLTCPTIIFFGALFIGAVILIAIAVVRRIRKREAEKTRVNKMLADYKMSALRAQMNPHFIFNCINSIQRYVLTSKTQDAYDYLAKFSKLIRLVLNLSEENSITLKQELEIVDLYVQMEQMRYENKFEYILEINPEVNLEELYVPSLLLQPYIENCIWHGIMNLKGIRPGKIIIRINCINDELLIEIEDNGVGREEAAKQKLAGHKSKALSINEKRIELIEGMNGLNSKILITDLKDSSGFPCGTLVTINIPQFNDEV